MWKSYWNGYVYNRKTLKVGKIILLRVVPYYKITEIHVHVLCELSLVDTCVKMRVHVCK